MGLTPWQPLHFRSCSRSLSPLFPYSVPASLCGWFSPGSCFCPSSSGEEGRSTRHSHPDTIEIRLLPALPDDWQVGTFRGLRTRGGFEVGVEWDRGAITSASLRPVVSRASGSGGGKNGESDTTEAEQARCRVLSRTRLKARLAFDGGAVLVPGEAGFELDEESVFEGGVSWYSVGFQAPRPGEQVLFSPVVS